MGAQTARIGPFPGAGPGRPDPTAGSGLAASGDAAPSVNGGGHSPQAPHLPPDPTPGCLCSSPQKSPESKWLTVQLSPCPEKQQEQTWCGNDSNTHLTKGDKKIASGSRKGGGGRYSTGSEDTTEPHGGHGHTTRDRGHKRGQSPIGSACAHTRHALGSQLTLGWLSITHACSPVTWHKRTDRGAVGPRPASHTGVRSRRKS